MLSTSSLRLRRFALGDEAALDRRRFGLNVGDDAPTRRGDEAPGLSTSLLDLRRFGLSLGDLSAAVPPLSRVRTLDCRRVRVDLEDEAPGLRRFGFSPGRRGTRALDLFAGPSLLDFVVRRRFSTTPLAPRSARDSQVLDSAMVGTVC